MPNSRAEWLIEEGIGEHRALLVENGEVVAAKLHWPGEMWSGQIEQARLVSKATGARRGTAETDSGRQVLVDKLPRDITEGESFALRITRAAIAERGRFKRPQGRFAGEAEQSDAPPTPFASLKGRVIRAFEAGLWEEVWSAASSASIDFAGGGIVLSATPAMTVIDVDCGQVGDAYSGAIPAIAKAVRWFDIGGNIGIDFPSIIEKGDRKAYDIRLGEYLDTWPHESTAMNGFGFVQIIARLEGPSLLHRFSASRLGMCARFALRAAERAEGTGPVLLLTVHPALKAKLKPEWLDELSRRTGRKVQIEIDPALALEAPSAQILGE